MSATILAGKAHNDKIGEVGYAGLAKFHFAWHHTGMAGDFKNDWLLMHKILFLEGLVEIELNTFFHFLCLFHLLFSLSLRKSNAHQFLNVPLKVTHLDVLIGQRIVEVFDVGVTAWVTDFYGQG